MPLPTFPLPPPTFQAKKARILSHLATPTESYTDKSPKGSVDAPIVDLIREINAIDGLVTTSSCSGRVAVFVEGPRDESEFVRGDGEGEGEGEGGTLTGSPAGKGGGRWLYVSHEPVGGPPEAEAEAGSYYSSLCGLSMPTPTPGSSVYDGGGGGGKAAPPRLVRLSFAPLILHVHCATLRHARPLLAAAVNAGFRESGVQSLRVLDDGDAGVTLAVRTVGLGFETVVGVVDVVDGESSPPPTTTTKATGTEICRGVVGEEYLSAMFGVVNERFEWNERRKERLRREIRRAFGIGGEQDTKWEGKDVRRARKREEGLEKQRLQRRERDRDRSSRWESQGGELDGEEEVVGLAETSCESIHGSNGDEAGDAVEALGGFFDHVVDSREARTT